MGCNSSKDAVMPLQPSSNHNNREPLLVLPANPVEGLVNGVQQDAHHQMNNVRQRVDQGAVAVAQRVDQLKKDAVQNVEEPTVELDEAENSNASSGKFTRGEMERIIMEITTDPMLIALQEGDIYKFRGLIIGQQFITNADDLLLKICALEAFKDEDLRCKFAESLLPHINAHSMNESMDYYPLHVAAENGLSKLLETLLTHPINPANPNVLTSTGETAIYSAVKGASCKSNSDDKIEKNQQEMAALKCIQLLVGHKCNLNTSLKQGQLTAVHLAAEKKMWTLVNYFLEQRANIDLKIEQMTARALIKKFYPHWVENYEFEEISVTDDQKNKLFEILENSEKSVEIKEREFAEYLANNSDIHLNVNEIYLGKYMLECAIKNRVSKAAETLITSEKDPADPNLSLFTAIDQGKEFFDILCTSRKQIDLGTKMSGASNLTVLHQAVLSKNPSVSLVTEILQRGRDQFGGKFSEWVNSQNCHGFTALHYAAKLKQEEIVDVLLKSSANIFIKDHVKVPAFYDMQPEVVEAFFDSQINLKWKRSSKSVANSKNCVLFDYNFMYMSNFSKIKRLNSESQDDDTRFHYETKKLTKRDKAKTIEDNQKFRGEIGPMKSLAKSERHKHLLMHPIITCILYHKWQKLKHFYLLNLILHILFMFSLTSFLSLLVFRKSSDIDKNSYNFTAFNSHWYTMLTSTLLFVLIEAFQYVYSRKNYFKRLENYLDIAIIVAMLILLLLPNSVKEISAFLYLFASLKLILLLGKHPRLATYTAMFTTVSKNFIKYLLMYLVLILAFAISFHFTVNCDGTCGNSAFDTLSNSIFRTLIMISGEYNVSEINFDSFTIASKFIFIAFLFLISIVMVNLLNGLAVSDTQQIRNKAKLQYCKTQIMFFNDVEKVYFALKNLDIFNIFKNLVFFFKKLGGEKILPIPLPSTKYAGFSPSSFYPGINEIIKEAILIAKKTSDEEEHKLEKILQQLSNQTYNL